MKPTGSVAGESRQTERLNAAADWWLRLREPNVSPATVAEWVRWCEADPANQEAFSGVQSLWQISATAPLRPAQPRELERPLLQRGWSWAAAAVAAGVTVAVLYFAQVFPFGAGGGERITTAVGVNRQLTLPDGSQVILGGASSLTMDFTQDRRVIHLLQGEAFFKVEPDRLRPFAVVTSGLTVTAVGTAFNVRADGSGQRVTVAEGSVDVVPKTAGDRRPIRLATGQQIALGAVPAVPEIVAANAQIATAWTTGTLKFLDEPLSAVVSTVNRYSHAAIAVQPPQLAELRYTGTVVVERIDEWLAALPNSFPVEVVFGDGKQVLIVPRLAN